MSENLLTWAFFAREFHGRPLSRRGDARKVRCPGGASLPRFGAVPPTGPSGLPVHLVCCPSDKAS